MTVRIIHGDCLDVLRALPDASVHCCVTSPPYFALRDYDVPPTAWPGTSYGTLGGTIDVPAMTCCLGLEPTPEAFIGHVVDLFRELHRVLRNDGTLWCNIGDSYATNGGPGWQGKNGQRSDRRFTAARNTVPMRDQARTAFRGHKPKDLIGIPWMLAFALRADGWYLRQDIIWSKPNPMPESVRDRCTKAHEYLFMLSKASRYYYDADAIREPLADKTLTTFGTKPRSKGTDGLGKIAAHNWAESVAERKPRLNADGTCAGANKRSVWTVATQPFKEAHFATFPPALIEPCILAGCPTGGVVLDLFGGSGTTGLVADRLQRDAILIELNPDYAAMAHTRIASEAPFLTDVQREAAA